MGPSDAESFACSLRALSSSWQKPCPGCHRFPRPCHHPRTLMLWSQAIWVLRWHHIGINSYLPSRSTMADFSQTGGSHYPRVLGGISKPVSLALAAADKGLCFVCRENPATQSLDPKAPTQTRLSSAFFSFSDLIHIRWVPWRCTRHYTESWERETHTPPSRCPQPSEGSVVSPITPRGGRSDFRNSGLRNHRLKPLLCYLRIMWPWQVT